VGAFIIYRLSKLKGKKKAPMNKRGLNESDMLLAKSANIEKL
jgi:hypothetical protein